MIEGSSIPHTQDIARPQTRFPIYRSTNNNNHIITIQLTFAKCKYIMASAGTFLHENAQAIDK